MVTFATLHWQAAAARLTGRNTVVFFSRAGLGRADLGKAFYCNGWPCIQIRAGLPTLQAVRVLLHEAAHLNREDCPDYKRILGRWVKTWAQSPPAHVRHSRIFAAEDELYTLLLERLADLQQSAGRPAGYWEHGGAVGGGVVNLIPAYEKDVLSCVY